MFSIICVSFRGPADVMLQTQATVKITRWISCPTRGSARARSFDRVLLVIAMMLFCSSACTSTSAFEDTGTCLAVGQYASIANHALSDLRSLYEFSLCVLTK